MSFLAFIIRIHEYINPSGHAESWERPGLVLQSVNNEGFAKQRRTFDVPQNA